MPSLLEVARVSKRFGSSLALDDLALDIRGGEVHALVGHNGSGKSTFVKILAGFHLPERGARAAIGGQPLPMGDGAAAYDAGLRFVHQDRALIDNLDAVDNLRLTNPYPLHRFGRIDWRRARRETEALLNGLGYDLDVRLRVSRLSLSDRTGVAIGRALQASGMAPRILVLDEATAALPSAGVARLFDVIRRLKSQGIGVLYISHHLDEIFEIGDRVSVLRDGRLVATQPVKAVTHNELVGMMIGQSVAVSPEASTPHATTGSTTLWVRDLTSGNVSGMDLTVAGGEVVGIAGVDGSGREDLASALFGSRPRRGIVSIRGHTIPPARPDLSINLGLGLLPCDRIVNGLFADMTLEDNVTLPRLPSLAKGALLDHRRVASDTRTWLASLDIRPPDPARLVRELSGGNQQKLLLARWLRLGMYALVLDEPTQGVDVAAVDRIYAMVQNAAHSGVAVVICSSDTDELAKLCSRVVVMHRGRIAHQLSGDAITARTIDALILNPMQLGAAN